ncbi:OLC1v1012977C3 [Oldenlandia corymbosa var. corymbosa]|uniref:OLC1v1012977C3 n=1 Tax=Oldenlandia corymbosa var. corymbosa TaxID=529605 RepID=A0AAV1DZ45_OLDCO|nr:OLC1v1012977C3 [Oldenlandia corymbosa var. corymbosa]
MILPGRSRICRVSIAPFSLGYFVKHHPTSPSRPFFSFTFKFNSNGRKPQSFTTTATRETSLLHTLTSTQQQQVELYIHSLLQWNQKMNLTAVKDENEAMERHVEDSLAIIEPITSSYLSHCGTSCENLNLIDVGTGAGLPGVILAIACPGWKLTLLESMRKRCDFLEHAVSVTGLSNVQVIRERAENLGHKPGLREVFDIAVARAVAEMRILAEYCLPLVRVGGLFVAAKGHDPQEEVKRAERAIKLMGASLLPTFTVKSHSKLGQRTAIVCLKEGSTPKKYPRDPGIPGKLPL